MCDPCRKDFLPQVERATKGSSTDLLLLDVVASSAQIPWEQVKNELDARCGDSTISFADAVSQLTEEIRSGKWLGKG